MSPLESWLRLAAAEAAPGQVVVGTVLVASGGEDQRVLARMRCVEWSAEGPQRVISVTPEELLHEGKLRAGAELNFNLPLPEAAVLSQAGALGGLRWEVVVSAISADSGRSEWTSPLRVVAATPEELPEASDAASEEDVAASPDESAAATD